MTYRTFRITGEMGSAEVFMTGQKLRWYEECKTDDEKFDFVAHEAWCQLWKSDAKKMLQNLCDKLGSDVVKLIFAKKIKIEEVT